MSHEIQAYRARWVFPVVTPPIENGIVVVRDGKILEVTSRDRWSGPITHDLGDAAIIPGLVNAHTHLEFSELEKPLGHQGISFAEWIELVIAHRMNRPADLNRDSIVAGFDESERCGVAVLGEISTSDEINNLPNSKWIKTIFFFESIGLSSERAAHLIQENQRRYEFRSWHVKFGISPHAPYTVRWDLFQALVNFAIEKNAPVAMHLAETREELELLASRTGSLRKMLERRGVWHDDAWPAVVSIADYLQDLATAPRALVVHGNYLTTRDLEIIAEHRERMSVIYCPRTHAYFEHSPHAYPEMIKKGINVALGTDSRASNPDLSLFEEMRTVAKQGRVSPEIFLRMGTLNGAEALGISAKLGSLKAGNVAALCSVSPFRPRFNGDPYQALFTDDARCVPVEGTWTRDQSLFIAERSKSEPD